MSKASSSKEKGTRNGNQWTEGRYRSFVTSCIRSGMRRWPPKYEVLKEAFTGQKVNKNSGRLAKHYRCARCKGDFTQTGIQVDHKSPVVDPKVGFVSWDVFIERLFCEASNLQVLCKPCHKEKSREEKAEQSKLTKVSKPKREPSSSKGK